MTENRNYGLPELLQLQEFAVITFHATSAALKAEKNLKMSGFKFVIIPTPREISSSCGLAVKIRPEDLEEVKSYLSSCNIDLSGCYLVNKTGNKKSVKSLP